ncbi:MAG: tRNA pseudouridine(55) synthase TruB, partial [Solirubrobacterales bacterium]
MSRSPDSSSGPDGIVLVDKPPGESSRRAAGTVARQLGASKFGHAGTLDPFATGLLVVLLGRACRTQDWFTLLPKAYDARARLGWTSTTGDPEGELQHTGRMPPEPLRLPEGRIMQRPPAFSAVHVGGRRAYELARAGEEVDLPPREVEVYEFAETGRQGDLVDLRISCSSGTYVRSLVSDLSDAYTTALTRTAVGPFALEDANPTRIVPIAQALPFLRSVELDEEEATAAGHGRRVPELTDQGGNPRSINRAQEVDDALGVVGAGAGLLEVGRGEEG